MNTTSTPTPEDVTMDTAPQAKYPALSPTFFRGGLPGQIRSVHKTRAENAAKVKDFKQAIADGEIKLEAAQLTTDLCKKLVELGVEVSEQLVAAVKAQAPKRETKAAELAPE